MAWIESHQSLARHRKTLAVASALKADRHKIIGHLQELWWWGLDNAESSGLLGNLSDAVIAEAAGWPMKQASMFVGALIDAGFIDRTDQGFVLHDWHDYAGKLNDQRELRKESNRKAQSAYRQRLRVLTVSADGNDTVSADGADSKHPTVPNRTQPNLTEPNQPIPPNPPSDQPKGGAIDFDERPKRKNAKRSTEPPACCPNFAQTGSEHWTFCPERPVEVAS